MDDSYISALPQAPTFTVHDRVVKEADVAAADLGFQPGLVLADDFFTPDKDGLIRFSAGGRAYVLRCRELGDTKLCSLYDAAEGEPDPPAVALDAFSRASGAIRQSLQELNLALDRLCDRMDLDDPFLFRQTSLAQRSLHQLERTALHLNLFQQLLSGTYPMNKVRCDVFAKLYALCSEAEYLLNFRNIRLTASLSKESVLAYLDWDLVSLLIWELLCNAAGQEVSEVFLDASLRDKQLLTLCVRSKLTAPLPDQTLQRWSEPPESVSELAKTGMGLSLAAAAARFHGGRLLLSTDAEGYLTALVHIRTDVQEDTNLNSVTLTPITSFDLGLTLLSPVLPAKAFDPRGL